MENERNLPRSANFAISLGTGPFRLFSLKVRYMRWDRFPISGDNVPVNLLLFAFKYRRLVSLYKLSGRAPEKLFCFNGKFTIFNVTLTWIDIVGVAQRNETIVREKYEHILICGVGTGFAYLGRGRWAIAMLRKIDYCPRTMCSG